MADPPVHGEGKGPSKFPPVLGDDTYGVWDDSHSGYGVIGTSDQHDGVRGRSDVRSGIYGKSQQGDGVTGQAFASGRAGVFASGDSGIEGRGGTLGVHGDAQVTGVVGVGGNAGVAAFNRGNSNAAYLASECCAAWFTGQVVVAGDFYVWHGQTKSAVVRHPDGSHRRLYCMESPESWFEDFGIGELREGQADVHLDRDFAALVHTDSYHVFLTPYGDSNGLYVAHMRPNGFVVREQHGGKTSLSFSYRVVAKRRDVTVTRLQPFLMPVQPVKPADPLHRQLPNDEDF